MLDRLCANNNMDNSKKQNKQTLKWRKNNDNNNSVREPTCRQHTARTAYHNPTSHNTTTNNKHQQEQQEGARCVVPCCSPALCERYVLIDGLHAYTTVTHQSPLTLHTHTQRINVPFVSTADWIFTGFSSKSVVYNTHKHNAYIHMTCNEWADGGQTCDNNTHRTIVFNKHCREPIKRLRMIHFK